MARGTDSAVPGWAWLVAGSVLLILVGVAGYFGQILVTGYLKNDDRINEIETDQGRHDERLQDLEREVRRLRGSK